MMNKSMMYLTAVVAALLLGGVTWAAHDVTAPGDPIQGVPNDGVSPGNNAAIGWPGNEGPDQAIDNQITTKFLHFKGEVEPTGIRVSPKSGPSVVTGVRLCTANDAVERDPVAYELSGSNDSIDGPYTLIAKGPITDFVGGVWARRTWNATPIAFTNTVSYKHYQLMLSPVSNPGSANSMQIAEIELLAADLKAYGPNPANGAVITMPLFQWTKGDTAQTHNVYLGTSPDLKATDLRASKSPVAMYYHVMPPLEPGVTYYWRVDEVDAAGTVITGDVWKVLMAPKTAFSPSPRDGDKWLSVSTSLAWQPGQNGIKHDVYFGTDKAKVEARDASVSKGTVSTLVFNPGALAQNTTYYWAVDETTISGTKEKGVVWSFTTVGGGGGVRGEYFASTNPTGVPLLTRIDQQININLTGATSPGAPVPGDGWSARWTADLEIAVADTYQFSLNCQDGTRMWIDGQLIIDKWVTPTVTSEYFSLPVTLERGIHALRVEFFDSGGDAVEQLNWSTATMAKVLVPVGPLQPPAHAQAIYPLNKAVDVEQDVTLLWAAGYKAKKHDVYFGTDQAAVANATTKTTGVYVGRQDKTAYTPSALDWNKTYYWRIDEVNDAEAASPWTGMVWSFTTANFLVIDNMEGYTDDPGNEIFSAWIDGFTDSFKSSHSTVGNATAPFAEQSFVHGGKQSLPMAYDNTTAPFFSEAVREFSPLANWSVNGINTLLVCVRGLLANPADKVYVVVEDSAGKNAVVTNSDTTVVSKGAWTEWKIPLSQFAGVDMTKVKKLYVGVGDRKATKAGTKGTVYFDDLAVIKQ